MNKDLIISIAGKLSADGLTKETLNKENALKICSGCVGVVDINYHIENYLNEITIEFLKLLPAEPTETKQTENMEVKIKKTWETIYFETKNASIELTLNHDEKTFNLSTEYEDNVSFKNDTIESAKEKLKCIECALNYVEQNLNKK